MKKVANSYITTSQFEKAMKRIDKRFDAHSGQLTEAVDAVLNGIDKIVGEIRAEEKKEHDQIRAEIKTESSHIRDEIKGLKAELSKNPSRDEFEDLKSRVQKLEKYRLQ